jgi:hypothetical protein
MKAAVLTHYNKKGTDDGVFSLDQVNEALDKVKRGGSKGKTILKV